MSFVVFISLFVPRFIGESHVNALQIYRKIQAFATDSSASILKLDPMDQSLRAVVYAAASCLHRIDY